MKSTAINKEFTDYPNTTTTNTTTTTKTTTTGLFGIHRVKWCQSLWLLYDSHFVGITRYNALSHVIRVKLTQFKKMSIWSLTYHTHTHTHPFNGPFSRTTQVSRYQKGKTNLDLTEARDSEWHWHHLGHMQVCTLLQTDSHASTQPLRFLQARCPSCHPTNSVKALKAMIADLPTKHI